MSIGKRYKSFIKLIIIGENLLIINGLYFILLFTFDLFQDANELYKILLALINLGYLLGCAIVNITVDFRLMNFMYIVNRILRRLFVVITISLLCLFLMKSSTVTSRAFILTYFISLFFLSVIAQIITKKVLLKILKKEKHLVKAIILGRGIIGEKIYNELTTNMYLGVKVFGFFDDNLNKADVLGTIDQVKDFIKDEKIEKIYCALPLSAKEKIKELIEFSDNNLIDFKIIPSVQYYSNVPLVLETEGNMPILSVRKIPLGLAHNALLKRVFDIMFSAIFLVTIFPVMFIILGVPIKLSSRGPIFFKQKRTGRNGEDFYCYKFRSMTVNNDADSKQATKKDPRITRIGRFMRKTNLDELPQFYNVLKGNMSVVGPRPHMIAHTSEYSELVDKYMVRHFIKPGITGWAQIHGCRGETQKVRQMERRIKKDIWYIENWTFLLDLEIILRTVFVTIKGDKNAF
jgi:putative colanic acid biosynthesis UDP-glucose lipid carrier transferase